MIDEILCSPAHQVENTSFQPLPLTKTEDFHDSSLVSLSVFGVRFRCPICEYLDVNVRFVRDHMKQCHKGKKDKEQGPRRQEMKVVIQSSNLGIKSSADFWYGWLNHFVCHAYGGKIPRNHPGHQTTFCIGDFFCCRFLEKRYAHSPLALLAPFPSQPQASWGVRFAGKRICIAHAKKTICITHAKIEKTMHWPNKK